MRPRGPLALLWVAALAVATAASAAEGGGGGGQALITPKIGLIFWTLITFVALLVFLRKVAWKPLLGAIEERERAIRESQEQAKRDRDEAASMLEQQRRMLGQARQERAEALEAGRRDAETLRAEILEEAKRQREQILKQTEAQVEIGLRQARGELKAAAADIAILAAEKLLAKDLDDAEHRKLVEEYLADLERMPGASTTPPS